MEGARGGAAPPRKALEGKVQRGKVSCRPVAQARDPIQRRMREPVVGSRFGLCCLLFQTSLLPNCGRLDEGWGLSLLLERFRLFGWKEDGFRFA